MRARAKKKADRKARLRKAAGAAIEQAIASGGDPVALMMAATGMDATVCGPYVQKHSLLRHLFKAATDGWRDREAAALATEPGPVVWVRRQFSSRKHAAYRLADVEEWHWSSISGGVRRRANGFYLHGYVWCDALIAGKLGHSCIHGPPPHRIKVCVTKKGNEAGWTAIEAAAPMSDKPEPRPKRKRRGRKRA